MRRRVEVEQRRRVGPDDGFTLIEVVVGMMLIVLVMTSSAGFFVRALAATRLMQQRQAAAAVAEQGMERVRAEPVTALVQGIDQNLGLPLSLTAREINDTKYRVGNVDYKVRTTIAICGLPPAGDACADVLLLSHLLLLRVTISVHWTPGANARCGGRSEDCEFSVTSLLDPLGTSSHDLTEVAS